MVGATTSSSSSSTTASLLGAGVRVCTGFAEALLTDFFLGEPMGKLFVPLACEATGGFAGCVPAFFLWKKPKMDFCPGLVDILKLQGFVKKLKGSLDLLEGKFRTGRVRVSTRRANLV